MKRLFVFFLLGVIVVGCSGTPDPVNVLEVDLSPLNGSPTSVTADVYATGVGRIDIEWFNRYDSSGNHSIFNQLLYVNGEGTYQSTYNSTINGYCYVTVSDSTGTVLTQSGEVFYGTEPRSAPDIKSLVADPNNAPAPVYVFVTVTLEEGGYPATLWFDDGDGGGGINDQVDSSRRTFVTASYDSAGDYLIIVGIDNKWGSEIDTVGVVITEN